MQCQKLFQANAPINCVCLHPNQAILVIGDQSGALHVWDLVRDTSSNVVSPLHNPLGHILHAQYRIAGNINVEFNLTV